MSTSFKATSEFGNTTVSYSATERSRLLPNTTSNPRKIFAKYQNEHNSTRNRPKNKSNLQSNVPRRCLRLQRLRPPIPSRSHLDLQVSLVRQSRAHETGIHLSTRNAAGMPMLRHLWHSGQLTLWKREITTMYAKLWKPFFWNYEQALLIMYLGCNMMMLKRNCGWNVHCNNNRHEK